MPETITIDPVVRIEGHLGIDVTVDKGEVIDAHTHGTLFRGAEIILVGRDPRDAPTITSYICGVCVSEHQLASAFSLEDAAKVNIPRNAILIRNIIEGATTLYSHLLHIFVLTGPDYDLYGLGNDKWAELLKEVVIPVQVNCHQIVAIWGGRSPHYYATVAGGEGVVPKSELIGMTLARMNLRLPRQPPRATRFRCWTHKLPRLRRLSKPRQLGGETVQARRHHVRCSSNLGYAKNLRGRKTFMVF